MRWSIVRLIWGRELRDQLRDRRTVFMIVVLPLLLYPILGFGVLQFALGFFKPYSVVAIQGAEHLPPLSPDSAGVNPLPAAAWFSLTPGPSASGFGIERLTGAAAWSQLLYDGWGQSAPPLVLGQNGQAPVPGETGYFLPIYFDSPRDADTLKVEFLESPEQTSPANILISEEGQAALAAKQIDVLLIVPPAFMEQLETGDRPALVMFYREKDERSLRVSSRVYGVLGRWKTRLKRLRLLDQDLPANFDDVFGVRDPHRTRSITRQTEQSLFDLAVRVLPFVLVMWSLAGALYPAVDLCAGEKERGTMETLLITPASRDEIVYGKFLTIWVFSASTAILNLACMGLVTWPMSGYLPHDALKPAALFWCVVLALPLSAFFSALCLAIGAYARSSKEGQYYLMPLFVVTMPLILATLPADVKLDAFTSLVPVTGVALLMQKLMGAASLDQVPWFYFLPVLAPIVLYSWLALRWAVEQFKREEVLFREAERLDIGLWIRHLFRDKEPLPSAGQAIFCFALILVLRWMSLGIDGDSTLLARTGIGLIAFVAAPSLLMAVLLTTHPSKGLLLRLPTARNLMLALLLALFLLPPLAEFTAYVLRQSEDLRTLLKERMPLAEELLSLEAMWWEYMLVLAVLPAICEELAFRGFILTGLRQRFGPWTAIFLSSFFFALFHLNLFQIIPTFLLGIVLGMIATRTGSVWPGMLFHLAYNSLLLVVRFLQDAEYEGVAISEQTGQIIRLIVSVCCALPGGYLLWRLGSRPAVEVK